MPGQHALLSASSAYRWLNCPPSAVLESKVEERTSVYAEEGTLAHNLAELDLRLWAKEITKQKYETEVKKIEKHDLYSSEMPSNVAYYTDYIKDEFAAAKAETPDAVLHTEKKVSLVEWIEESFGTCDGAIIANETLTICDLKYGKGVQVEATKNPQLMLYALGALVEYDFIYDIEEVKLVIIQPRLDHISEWTISKSDLYAWAEKEVKPKARLAHEGKGIQKAGDHCKFCKVKARCATLASQNLKVAKHDFKDPHLLTDDQLLEVYKHQPLIADWIKSVAEYMLAEAKNGKEWPGYKLVEAGTKRKIGDEENAVNKLRDLGYSDNEIYNTKLKGLDDLTTLLGKAEFSRVLGPFIVKPQGAPILVENSDKRPALKEQAKTDFKD